MSSLRTVKRISGYMKEVFGRTHDAVGRDALETAQRMIEDTRDAREIALPFAERLTRKLGLDPEESLIEGPPKSLFRIFEKAYGKYKGVFEDVPDYQRVRILVESPDDIIALRRMLLGDHPTYHDKRIGDVANKHPNNQITIKEFEDYFWEPSSTGRVGIHLQLDVKLTGTRSVPFEIQVIHKGMLETEEFTHRNYEKACMIERHAKIAGRTRQEGTETVAVLTPEEIQIKEGYEAANQAAYLADCLNYDLMKLRHPRHRARNFLYDVGAPMAEAG